MPTVQHRHHVRVERTLREDFRVSGHAPKLHVELRRDIVILFPCGVPVSGVDVTHDR